MSVNISIKLKLTLVVVVAVLVFVVQGGAAFQILSQMNETAEMVSTAQRVQASVQQTEIGVLSLLEKRSQISAKSIDEYKAQIAEVRSSRLVELKAATSALNETQLLSASNTLESELTSYLQVLEQWVDQQHQLGWGDGSGLLGKLEKSAVVLGAGLRGFSTLERDLQRMRAAEKDFNYSADAEDADRVRMHAEDLQLNLKDLSFEEEYGPALNNYLQAFEPLAKNLGELKRTEKALADQIPKLRAAGREAANLLTDTILPNVHRSAETAKKRAQTVILAVAVVGGLILVLLIYWIGRGTLINLRRTSNLMQTVAKGDLTAKISHTSNDEFATLSNAANTMVTNLRGVVSESSNVSQEMVAMSEQLSGATSRLLEGNQKISRQMQEVATASEEMNATSIEVADGTEEVNRAAQKTTDASAESVQVIRRTDDAIKDINNVVQATATNVHTLSESSTRIGMVVEVIDALADQTNLLALNAAIEAARAGEAGRGFAVVADEVRKLAEKTVSATTEITEIIEQIQEQSAQVVNDIERGQAAVEVGTKLGDEALGVMEQIEEQTNKVSDRTSHIASAMEQMRATIAEISRNIETVAHEVEKDETTVREIADAAQRVAAKSNDLRVVGANFKT